MKVQIITTMILLVLCITSCSKDDDPQPSLDLEMGMTGDDLLIPNTLKIIDDSNIPAIAAMTMKNGEILEKVELGVQRINDSDSIIENSKWHIGSITKSMTATLTGILIEQGYLNWDTRIGNITTDGYLVEYQNITIYQLLSHTGGITGSDYPIDPADTRSVSEIRQEWAIAALNEPIGTVGKFEYSNSGYVIAGVMLELTMNTSWEELIDHFLFTPLGMADTGFGAPGKDGEANQPWGHLRSGNSWNPKDPIDIYSDNPKALGPGGTVHTTLLDLSKYINLHLGKTSLIDNSTLQILHTEVNNSGYALGWNITASGITHAGSNTNWFAQLYINLSEEFANLAMTNSYDHEGEVSIPAVQNMMTLMGNRFSNLKQ